jgi:methionyl-tRNA formyltransferase
MRIVMFARVPGWYSFHQDRLARRFQAGGHEVVGIVVEKTRTLASLGEWMHKLGLRVMIQKVLKRLVKRGSSEQAQTNGVRRIVNYPPCNARVCRIASHNSDECLKIVGELQPEVLVLRGCLIINKGVLQVPKFGAINPHYALLPAYRGMELTEWSLLHGDPCAVSVHWVAEAVDAGGVITSRLLDVKRGESLGDLREKCAALSDDFLVEALRRIKVEKIRTAVVSPSEGRQHFVMHPRLYRLAEQRSRLAWMPAL